MKYPSQGRGCWGMEQLHLQTLHDHWDRDVMESVGDMYFQFAQGLEIGYSLCLGSFVFVAGWNWTHSFIYLTISYAMLIVYIIDMLGVDACCYSFHTDYWVV